MKRPAAAAVASPRKRAAMDPVAKKCVLVAKAIAEADLAESVKKMLANAVESSLGIAADERHRFQASAVEMTGTVLDAIHEALKTALADAHTKVDGMEADKTARESAVADAEASLALKSAAIAEREDALTADTAALDETGKALEAAEAAQVSGDAEFRIASVDKSSIEDMLTSVRGPMKEAAVHAADLKRLLVVCKKAGCEETLMTSVSTALKEVPTARGTFSNMAVDQLAEHLSKSVDGLATKIAEGDSASAQRAAAVEAAKTALDSATDKKACSAAALVEAKAAHKEAMTVLKEAKVALKHFEPEKKQVAANLGDVTQKLNDFAEGPLAAYRELRDRTISPPSVPESEQAPAAEAAGLASGPDAVA